MVHNVLLMLIACRMLVVGGVAYPLTRTMSETSGLQVADRLRNTAAATGNRLKSAENTPATQKQSYPRVVLAGVSKNDRIEVCRCSSYTDIKNKPPAEHVECATFVPKMACCQNCQCTKCCLSTFPAETVKFGPTRRNGCADAGVDGATTHVSATMIRSVQVSLRSSNAQKNPKIKKYNFNLETIKILGSLLAAAGGKCDGAEVNSYCTEGASVSSREMRYCKRNTDCCSTQNVWPLDKIGSKAIHRTYTSCNSGQSPVFRKNDPVSSILKCSSYGRHIKKLLKQFDEKLCKLPYRRTMKCSADKDGIVSVSCSCQKMDSECCSKLKCTSSPRICTTKDAYYSVCSNDINSGEKCTKVYDNENICGRCKFVGTKVGSKRHPNKCVCQRAPGCTCLFECEYSRINPNTCLAEPSGPETAGAKSSSVDGCLLMKCRRRCRVEHRNCAPIFKPLPQESCSSQNNTCTSTTSEIVNIEDDFECDSKIVCQSDESEKSSKLAITDQNDQNVYSCCTGKLKACSNCKHHEASKAKMKRSFTRQDDLCDTFSISEFKCPSKMNSFQSARNKSSIESCEPMQEEKTIKCHRNYGRKTHERNRTAVNNEDSCKRRSPVHRSNRRKIRDFPTEGDVSTRTHVREKEINRNDCVQESICKRTSPSQNSCEFRVTDNNCKKTRKTRKIRETSRCKVCPNEDTSTFNESETYELSEDDNCEKKQPTGECKHDNGKRSRPSADKRKIKAKKADCLEEFESFREEIRNRKPINECYKSHSVCKSKSKGACAVQANTAIDIDSANLDKTESTHKKSDHAHILLSGTDTKHNIHNKGNYRENVTTESEVKIQKKSKGEKLKPCVSFDSDVSNDEDNSQNGSTISDLPDLDSESSDGAGPQQCTVGSSSGSLDLADSSHRDSCQSKRHCSTAGCNRSSHAFYNKRRSSKHCTSVQQNNTGDCFHCASTSFGQPSEICCPSSEQFGTGSCLSLDTKHANQTQTRRECPSSDQSPKCSCCNLENCRLNCYVIVKNNCPHVSDSQSRCCCCSKHQNCCQICPSVCLRSSGHELSGICQSQLRRHNIRDLSSAFYQLGFYYKLHERVDPGYQARSKVPSHEPCIEHSSTELLCPEVQPEVQKNHKNFQSLSCFKRTKKSVSLESSSNSESLPCSSKAQVCLKRCHRKRKPSQVGPCQTEPSHTGPCQTEPSHTGPCQTEPSHTGPSQTEPSHTGPCQTEPSHTGQCQTDRSHTFLIQTEPSHTFLIQTEPSHTGPCQTEKSPKGQRHADPGQTDPSQRDQGHANRSRTKFCHTDFIHVDTSLTGYLLSQSNSLLETAKQQRKGPRSTEHQYNQKSWQGLKTNISLHLPDCNNVRPGKSSNSPHSPGKKKIRRRSRPCSNCQCRRKKASRRMKDKEFSDEQASAISNLSKSASRTASVCHFQEGPCYNCSIPQVGKQNAPSSNSPSQSIIQETACESKCSQGCESFPKIQGFPSTLSCTSRSQKRKRKRAKETANRCKWLSDDNDRHFYNSSCSDSHLRKQKSSLQISSHSECQDKENSCPPRSPSPSEFFSKASVISDTYNSLAKCKKNETHSPAGSRCQSLSYQYPGYIAGVHREQQSLSLCLSSLKCPDGKPDASESSDSTDYSYAEPFTCSSKSYDIMPCLSCCKKEDDLRSHKDD